MTHYSNERSAAYNAWVQAYGCDLEAADDGDEHAEDWDGGEFAPDDVIDRLVSEEVER
jgi:hypothetical protein